MQPYFFPYIGYWQLINAVDEFILFDEVQYIRHGWINRNRILKKGGGWRYIQIPIEKHSRETLIKDIKIVKDIDIRGIIANALSYYKEIRAPNYEIVMNIINDVLVKDLDRDITKFNKNIMSSICNYLGIKTPISISSDYEFDYTNVRGSGDWALEISKQMEVDEYINPIGGKELFDVKKFDTEGIKIRFLEPYKIEYKQVGDIFKPSLSIIDVLMFNEKDIIVDMLNKYRLYSGD